MHDVVVANGRTFGGGMIICPEAEPDDGLFDVLTIGDLTKRDLLVTLPKTYRGKHLPHPKAELLRGAVVTVDASDPLPIELDGEQPGTTPVRFEVAAGRAASSRSGLTRRSGGGSSGVVGLRAATASSAEPTCLLSAATCCSSFSTRCSSSSSPRMRFCMSSRRVFVWFAMSTSREPPGTSESFCSASSPRSWKRVRMSFWDAFVMGRFYARAPVP